MPGTRKLHFFLISLFCVSSWHCSQEGFVPEVFTEDEKDKPDPPPKEEPKEPPRVGLQLMDYKVLKIPTCKSMYEVPKVNVSDDYIIDGQLSSEEIAHFQDPQLNLNQDWIVGVNPNRELYFSVQKELPDNSFIEFGQLVEGSEGLQSKVVRKFQIKHDEIFEVNGTDSDVAGRLKRSEGESFTELSIKPQAIRDIVNLRLWWIKIHPSNLSEMSFFRSLEGGRSEGLQFRACGEWEGLAELPFQRHVAISFAGKDEVLELKLQKSLEMNLMARTKVSTFLNIEEPQLYASILTDMPGGELLGASVGIDAGFFTEKSYQKNIPAIFHSLGKQMLFKELRSKVLASSFHYAIFTSLLNKFLSNELGLKYWLERYPYTAFDEGELNRLEESDREDYRKAQNFGHLLADTLEEPILSDSWLKWSQLEDQTPDAFLNLLSGTDANLAETASQLFAGWYVGEIYHTRFDPIVLKDTDGEGLPDFFELRQGTHIEKRDSDNDGWTDYAELLDAKDPLNKTSHPATLIEDSSFLDWLQLIPKRLLEDEGFDSGCPTHANITNYGALVLGTRLMIASSTAGIFYNIPPTLWEIYLTSGQVDPLVLSFSSDSRKLVIRDTGEDGIQQTYHRAFTSSGGAIEWIVDLDKDKIFEFLNPENIRIRMRTSVNGPNGIRFCDEIDWFVPEQVATSVN